MTNLSKTFKCGSCSTDFPLSLTTNLELDDVTLLSRCPKCGNSMQIHLMVVKPGAVAAVAQQESPLPNLDESIFSSPEMPSSEIKKLIEE